MLKNSSRAILALSLAAIFVSAIIGTAGADDGDPLDGDLVPLVDKDGNYPICKTSGKAAKIPLEPPEDLAVVSGDGVFYPTMDAAVLDLEARGLITRQRTTSEDGVREEVVVVSGSGILYPHVDSVCSRSEWNPIGITSQDGTP